ncbi:MAG: S1C family serine protease [Dehalococcoidia bacterium]
MAVAAIVGVACGGGDGGDGGVAPTPGTTASPPATTVAPDGGGQALAIPDIVALLRPSVVQVQTEEITLDMFGQPAPQQGVGTGVIIDSKGLIVTNDHVLRLGGAGDLVSNITVTLSDGRTFDAAVVGNDRSTDLAVIRIDADNLQAARLGDVSALRVGDTVVAIGHALALEGGPTVTSGVVSAKERVVPPDTGGITLVGLIQTDAAINPGNSGGPLVNVLGEVVGVNTAVFRGGATPIEGIGFAISMDNARPVVAELIETGRVERGFLGIGFVEIDPGFARANELPVERGIGVTDVQPGSGADQAGLEAGDIIVRIDRMEIRNSGDLVQALAVYKPGEQAEVEFLRGSQRRTAEVTLGSQP